MTANRYPLKIRGFNFIMEAQGFANKQAEAEALSEFKHQLRDSAAEPRQAAALFGGLLAYQSGHPLDDLERDQVTKAQVIAAGLEAYEGDPARLALRVDF